MYVPPGGEFIMGRGIIWGVIVERNDRVGWPVIGIGETTKSKLIDAIYK